MSKSMFLKEHKLVILVIVGGSDMLFKFLHFTYNIPILSLYSRSFKSVEVNPNLNFKPLFVKFENTTRINNLMEQMKMVVVV